MGLAIGPPQEATSRMSLRWTEAARADLLRLHDIIAPDDPRAAKRVVQTILAGIRRLPRHPRLGLRLAEHAPREVRR